MKERILLKEDLGSYAYDPSYYTTSGYTDLERTDAMEFTWTDTCHKSNHQYTSVDTSGCNNLNNYETSKIKEMLENRYMPTLGESNLKEVDGYKIRLITLEELQQNLGVSTTINESFYDVDTENTPTWVYQNFGETDEGIKRYWTMTSAPDSTGVWHMHSSGAVYGLGTPFYSFDDIGVRPVINLLKTAIE